jgi:mono/diheme cytochrome c family protein
MVRRALIGLAIVAAIGAVAFWTLTSPARLGPALISQLSAPGDAQAGKIVFFAGGCESCHMSPGQDDPLKLGGGQELKSPFGSFYPPNISPDAKDGIGGWTAQDLAGTLLLGVTPADEHEYPALPYPSYRHMAVKDVRDLYAFLRTLPPVSGRAPPHRLVFPLAWRRLVGGWKLLFLGPPDGPESVMPRDDLAFGRYLIEGPGHCGECHTPRNALGAMISSLALTGAPLPEGRGKSPDVSPKGLKDWTEDDVATALTTGFTPTGDTLGGPMAAVVRNVSQLPPDYAKAMARYLKRGG